MIGETGEGKAGKESADGQTMAAESRFGRSPPTKKGFTFFSSRLEG